MNLADSLARTAAAHPDRVAIRLGEQILTYRDLDDASARVAGLLAARDVEPGHPVGVMLPNVPRRCADEPAAQGSRGRLLPG